MDPLSAIRGPYWQKDASCTGKFDLFFFEDDNPSKEDAAPALRVCRSCPVREACLAYAVETQPEHGVWGGKTAREIRALKSKEAAA